MKNRRTKFTLFLLVMIFVLSFTAQAKTTTGWVSKNGQRYYYSQEGVLYKNKWFEVDGKRYFATSTGAVATGLTKINDDKYYFLSTGESYYGWKQIGSKKYYFLSTTRAAIKNQIYTFKNGKAYYFNVNGVMRTGWRKVNDQYYYFNEDMKTGWLTIGENTYYLIKSASRKGQRATGLFSVSGKMYYFDPSTGILQKSQTIYYKDRRYIADAQGVCTLVPENITPSSDMLFFLTFESGSEAYNQTGGDNGCACGAYQFDYRYALLPFVKYAYSENPVVCKEFEPYAQLTTGTTLKSNKKFYKAWNKIYKRNPKIFSQMQDTFARVNYYDNVERNLFTAGIDISSRSDVVKGAVFSYSIQHGQLTAANAVKAIKATSAMTDATFLKKLYKYRIKQFPAYSARYKAEYALALSKLK
ncbi:MAG: N-acetylmuramoyl-L-alanine amidase family protein [Muricoprocola sp.]